VRQAYATAPDARFIVHAGDLVNRAHADREWGEWFRAGGPIHAMVPSIPAPGNHEYRGYTEEEEEQDIERLSVFWRAQFTLPEHGAQTVDPETNYYVDYQGVRIVVLNSDQERDGQAAWLEQVLSTNPNRWTIATHHHPIFSSASDRDNANCARRGSRSTTGMVSTWCSRATTTHTHAAGPRTWQTA
ncbi:MAG: metallophosphoesterase family protein, partial [Longimicrobiales bacterium]